MDILTTSGLGKDYGALKAVLGLDLAVREGEVFGFLGPNGAGKTTSISMMTGVVTPSRGRTVVGGHDLAREPQAAKRLLGLVPQEIAVYDELSARQNLAYFGSLYGLRGAALAEAVRWTLGVADLMDRADEPVQRFSGGMKRRLNLAAGLVHRPRVLVCDEPTVGVDAQSRAHLFETLKRLNAEHGMTIVYTSHYMEEVQALCSRIGIMDQGRLVALDSLDALLRAHGHPGVEVEAEGAADAIEAALATLGKVERHGAAYRLPAEVPASKVASALEGKGLALRSLRVANADLETVFLNLTGRALRDAA